MDAHNVFHRFNSLIQTRVPNHDFIENSDCEITRASVHAENKCRNRKPSAYWTQELHQLKLHHSVWCQLKSRLKQRFPITHIIHRSEQHTIPITMTTTIAKASDAITKLRRSISEIHKGTTKRPQQYVLDPANISEDKGDGKRAKILR